jgi:hypothetical protein
VIGRDSPRPVRQPHWKPRECEGTGGVRRSRRCGRAAERIEPFLNEGRRITRPYLLVVKDERVAERGEQPVELDHEHPRVDVDRDARNVPEERAPAPLEDRSLRPFEVDLDAIDLAEPEIVDRAERCANRRRTRDRRNGGGRAES